MKVGIFYLAYAPGGNRQRIELAPEAGAVYIRVEVVDAPSEGAALDDAQCRAGEAVMNSHMVPAADRKAATHVRS